jgi:hypothetical protein
MHWAATIEAAKAGRSHRFDALKRCRAELRGCVADRTKELGGTRSGMNRRWVTAGCKGKGTQFGSNADEE